MANEILVKQGTTVTWSASSATPTYNVEMASMVTGSGAVGPEHDFGATFAGRVRLCLTCGSFNAAPTAGTTVDLYWASSHDGTNYDAEVTGASAGISSEDQVYRARYVGSLRCSNATTAQRASWDFMVPARYGCPIVMNQSGQSFVTTGSLYQVALTPLVDESQ